MSIPRRIPESNNPNESKAIGINIHLQERQSIEHQNIQAHTINSESGTRLNKESPHAVQSNQDINEDLSSPNVSVSDAHSVSNSVTFDSELSHDYDYIEFVPVGFSKKAAPGHKSCLRPQEMQNDEIYTEPYFNLLDVEKSRQNIAFKAESGSAENMNCLSAEVEQSLSSEIEETTCIQKHALDRSRKVSIRNQTQEDFFQYSVSETSECFKMCGLVEFAEKSLEFKLDGSFFRNFDLQVLKEEPFYFTRFHILMIKKIIFEGWRPKV